MSSNDLHFEPSGHIAVSADSSVGVLGEAIAAQWVMANGGHILHHRWHCRWGELDLIAHGASPQSSPQHLAFIEVKTRQSGSWDANGLMSITPQKQQKLWQAAELFLATFPHYALLPCRFDLALIRYRRSPKLFKQDQPTNQPQPRQGLSSVAARSDQHPPTPFTLIPTTIGRGASTWVSIGAYHFRLEQYIKHAFEQ